MLFSSTDEQARALIEEYNKTEKQFEKNLISLSIRTEGKLTLDDVYNMPYLMREMYIESMNEFVDEQNKKMKGN